MKLLDLARPAVVLVALATWGCDDAPAPLPLGPEHDALRADGAAEPAALVTVALAGGDLTFWPYINSRPEETPHDPVNLVFTGHADPRNVRAALMSLDGARPAPFSDFTCTWTDAIGAIQVSYGSGVGWTGSVIQLECGAYDPFRFHIRLFPVGGRTLGNAHVEILIPGTQAHQVLNWEAAERFIMFELARGGLLGAAPARTGLINQGPTFREIPAQIYNLLTPELRDLAGGPAGNVSDPVGIANDGSATVLHVGRDVAAGRGTHQAITIAFGQFVPKPFCAAPGELIRVDGSLDVSQTVTVTAAGELASETLALGELLVRSVTAAGLGEPIVAKVRDHARAEMRDDGNYAASDIHQQLIPGNGPVQQLKEQLRVGPHALTIFRADEICG